MFIGMAIKQDSCISFWAGSEEVKLKLHNNQSADKVIPLVAEYRFYKLEYHTSTQEIHSIFDISAQRMIWQSDE
jgi:hypothetical protein